MKFAFYLLVFAFFFHFFGIIYAIVSLFLVYYISKNSKSDESPSNEDKIDFDDGEDQIDDDDKSNYSGDKEKDLFGYYTNLFSISSNYEENDLKIAYRKNISRFHPDKIQGMHLDEDFILFANERSKEINDGYRFLLDNLRKRGKCG